MNRLEETDLDTIRREAGADHVGHDAWKQLDDLYERFTRAIDVRPDLKVEAFGCERSVRFTWSEYDHTKDKLDPRHKRSHSTERNVSTMRELAEALLLACDFVEHVNPVWARRAA